MNSKKPFKKFLLITTAAYMISTSVSCAFTDLAPTHWAYNVVNEMVNKNVLSGYNDGTFKPDSKITRAEFSTILVKTLGIENNGENIQFNDVDDHWAKDFINLASPFLSGYTSNGANYFNPEDPAIREDAAVAIVKAKGLDVRNADINILNRFSDKDSISKEAKEYVAVAVSNGLMNGNANGTFNPKGNLTRAEVAALFNNIYKYEENTDAPIITVSNPSGSELIPGDRVIVTVKSEIGLESITYSWNNGKEVNPLENEHKIYNEYEITMAEFPKVNDTYVLKINAIDVDGNSTGIKEYSYKILYNDNTKPFISMSEPDGSVLDAGARLTLVVEDNESKIVSLKYKWLGSPEKVLIPDEKGPANTCTIIIPRIGSEKGTYKFYVTATNESGEEVSQTYTYYVGR